MVLKTISPGCGVRASLMLFLSGLSPVMSMVLWLWISTFYPTALKDCRGIVFSHGVLMGGRLSGKSLLQKQKQTVRCRKLILGRDIG